MVQAPALVAAAGAIVVDCHTPPRKDWARVKEAYHLMRVMWAPFPAPKSRPMRHREVKGVETSPSKALASSAAVAAEVVVGVRMGEVSRLEVEPKGVPVRVEGGMVPPAYVSVAEVVMGGRRQVSWVALELNTGQGTPHTVTLVVPVLVGKVVGWWW